MPPFRKISFNRLVVGNLILQKPIMDLGTDLQNSTIIKEWRLWCLLSLQFFKRVWKACMCYKEERHTKSLTDIKSQSISHPLSIS